MKSVSYFLVIVFVSVSILACTSKRDKLKTEIQTIENQIKTKPQSLDPFTGQKLINSYMKYYENFPDDSVTPFLLMRAAEMSMSIKNPRQTLSILNNLHKKYTNFEKLPEVIIYKGFVYENDLKNVDSAKYWYEYFLKNYPTHELAPDIQTSLKYLGMTPEEIFQSFSNKNTEEIK